MSSLASRFVLDSSPGIQIIPFGETETKPIQDLLNDRAAQEVKKDFGGSTFAASTTRTRTSDMDAEELAKLFHETYERLAPKFGYETRKASAKPWAEVPEQNRKLMIAVCGEILESLESGCMTET